MLNQNTVKNPGIEFLTVREMGINKFGYLNSSLYFYFVTKLRKKNYGARTLTAESHLPPYEPVRS